IERVEGFARGRFRAVANKVGIAEGPGREPHKHYGWDGYFNFLPYYNANITNPIPIVETDAGKLAVAFGTHWVIGKGKYRHELGAEAAFSARLTYAGIEEDDEPTEVGYVRLGRLFRGADIDNDAIHNGWNI